MPEALFLVFRLEYQSAKACKFCRSRQELSNEDEGADRPGRRAAGAGGAASRKEAAKTAAPGRRQKASSGDQGTQRAKKARVTPKEK